SCGGKLGTGWLIVPGLIMTARHCILEAIEKEASIEIAFDRNQTEPLIATIHAVSEEFDVCLLALDSTTDFGPLKVSTELPREGEAWWGFGFPSQKRTLGHRLSGAIQQVLQEPQLRMDVDLSVDAS